MNRRKRIFDKVVMPLISKYMIDPFKYKGSCIASGIPIKYLKYFKEVTAHKNAMNIRYRYRGVSKPYYQRPQSFCHMHGADTFALYTR
jgi:hypothetical protein|tara:strand:+ start:58 stop:321 length:264 start_codon:yes stop_codon:yes gene_type:complete